MADNKRNNVAGKVATPKTTGTPSTATQAAQPVVDTLDALSKSIGARIKLTTAAPHSQNYEGTLFTACPVLNIVAINTRAGSSIASSDAAAQAGDYHIIPVSKIQSFQVLALGSKAESGDTSFASAQPPIGPVDIKRLRAREQARINKLKEDEMHRGKGVTPEAQAIYDSFKRINMSVRWHNQDMVVSDAVIISAPYRAEDCKSMKGQQSTLNRVKQALEDQRRKRDKEKDERERKAATPVGPRKGG